jgi:hypothetical protein
MVAESSERMKIAIYYAAWVIVCAAAAGFVIALIHTSFFSYVPNRSGLLATLFGDAVIALAIAAGQGAVALVTGSSLARFGRELRGTVLLGLLVGLFDCCLYFLQMAVPQTELGWPLDIAILVLVTIAITFYGSAPAAAGAPRP